MGNLLPEHEKLRKIQEKSQVIGEFIETSGYFLAEYRCPHGFQNSEDCTDSEYCQEGREVKVLWQVSLPIEKILAKHFGIDLNKLEAEKQQILKEARELNEQ